jgi:photosystem II stability/assembly factor-like uncharacterized protein
MKTKFLLPALILLVTSISSQWVSATSGTTNFLTSVQLITATINYAVGFSGTVLKSTNTGQTWSPLTSPDAGNINKIFFVPTGSATTGWAASVSGLYKSTNGGVNWVQQISATVFADLLFPDVTTGIGLTTSNTLRRTTNGGTNFTTINYTSDNGIHGEVISLGNSSTYFILGLDNAIDTSYVFKSTNAGVNWTQAANLPGSYFAMTFVNASTGIICGDNGIMKRTTNGGTNWTTITAGTTNDLQAIKFVTSTKVYAVGSAGTILKSTDAGATWVSQVSGTTVSLRGFDMFATDDFGVAAGAGGTMRRTTNGGAITGFIQQSNEIPDNYSLSQNYPNPFNPVTNINFQISKQGFVKLTVFDVLGKEIALLVSQSLSSGSYKIDFDASSLPSGTYFYRMQTESFSETKKMILIK